MRAKRLDFARHPKFRTNEILFCKGGIFGGSGKAAFKVERPRSRLLANLMLCPRNFGHHDCGLELPLPIAIASFSVMIGHVAILVHGTFASDATWIDSDSAIAVLLREALPGVHIIPFRWSGANTHSARLVASIALEDKIAETTTQYPGASIHLIGHSHGGNVILYALGWLRARPPIVALAFLGTPFLTPILSDIGARMGFFKNVTAFIVLFIPMTLAAGVASWLVDYPPFTIAVSQKTLVGDMIFVGMFFGMILAGAIVGAHLMQLTYEIAPKLEAAILKRQALEFSKLAQARPDFPMFVATVPFDEASLLLNFWDKLTFVPQALNQTLRDLLGGVAVGIGLAFIISCGFFMIEGFLGNFGIEFSYLDGISSAISMLLTMLFFSSVSVLAFGIVALLVASLFRGSKMAFGGESPIFVAALRVVARTRPDWPLPRYSRVRSYSAKGGFHQLRHSTFYENDAVLQDLAQWIVYPTSDETFNSAGSGKTDPATRTGKALYKSSALFALISTFALSWFAHSDPRGFESLTGLLWGQ
jgi:hypothetical protein